MNRSLPIHYYTEDSVQKAELQSIFATGLRYRGHALMADSPNKYISLPHTNERWMLVNDEGTHKLLSNVCLHRQSQIVEGSGCKKLISCRVHCWTYKLDGTLKAAPHFKEKPDSKLETRELTNWNGLLFEGRAPQLDLKACGIDEYINFDEYFFHKVETTEYNYNWKTFSEIYLENYHVFSMHPGLRNFVTPSDLEWHFGEDYSVQKVGLGSNLDIYGSEIYKEWQNQVKSEFSEKLPRYGAIWIYLYPNIMIEWYPNTMAISTIYPIAPNKCVNHVEYYYKKAIYEETPAFYQAIEQVYSETAKEDEEACLLLERGRTSLYLNGESETGPCDPFLEAGVQHFYDYVLDNL